MENMRFSGRRQPRLLAVLGRAAVLYPILWALLRDTSVRDSLAYTCVFGAASRRRVSLRSVAEVATPVLIHASSGDDLGATSLLGQDATPADYSEAFVQHAGANDADGLRQSFQLAKDRQVSLASEDYRTLFDALVQTDPAVEDEDAHSATLRQAWQMLQGSGCKLDEAVYASALGACGHTGDVELAGEVWQRVQNELGSQGLPAEVVTASTLAALLEVAGSQRDSDLMASLWAQYHEGLEMTAEVYAAKAKAMVLCGQEDSVIEVMQDALSSGVSPSLRLLLNYAQALLLVRQRVLMVDSGSRLFADELKHARRLILKSVRTSTLAGRSLPTQLKTDADRATKLIASLGQGGTPTLVQARVFDWPWSGSEEPR
eukprot:TRINITY_DN123818_c0_g1_i1.p1 TRINITY_DN123818_c0_g1~~TRINITY_DN123818_c0_g1_i1.p1  ORF type:complete len:374 (-),score=43.10 TRINITY_DN123818_c0_g1_i1:20-1141(-)